jgi:hypothetical protein
MEMRTFAYGQGEWSARPLPDLDSDRTLVLAFGSSRFGAAGEPLAELARAYPKSHLLGCSTSGEIHGTKLSDDTIAVAVVRFAHTRLRRADASVRGQDDSFRAGEAIARELVAPDLRGVFLLSDGLSVNGSELVRGLNSVLPEAVVVTGGLAGDGPRFQRTWTLTAEGPRSGVVSAVAMYGDRVHIGHGSRGGWDIFGPARLVTRSEGNVLYELDGKPALALYKDYLGERSSGLPATALLFPLALRASATAQREVVRTVLAVDEASQSMTFAGDIPEKAVVRLMRANFDRVIQGAGDAGLAASTRTAAAGHGSPVLAISISCVGRRLVLGERTEEEIEAVGEALPAGAEQVGFYSYGEISPHGFGACDLHNQTMTLTTICER